MFSNNLVEVRLNSDQEKPSFTNRNIPEPMKRAIRQRCGFGCVICGGILYDYDHMLNDWAVVKEHVESDITLLCTMHHREKTLGLLDRKQVAEANKNPHNLQQDQTSPHLLNFAGKSAIAVVANNVFTNAMVRDAEGKQFLHYMVPICIDGIPIIGFNFQDHRLLLHVNIHNEYNERILVIHDNQLVFKPDTWDVYIKGSTLYVREGARKILLELDFCPPNKIVIKRAKLRVNGVVLELKKDHIVINDKKSQIFENNHFSVPVGISIGNTMPFPSGAVHEQQVARYK